MFRISLLAFVVGALSCAHRPAGWRVEFPDASSESSRLWACFRGEKGPEHLICLDLKAFLQYVSDQAAAEEHPSAVEL